MKLSSESPSAAHAQDISTDTAAIDSVSAVGESSLSTLPTCTSADSDLTESLPSQLDLKPTPVSNQASGKTASLESQSPDDSANFKSNPPSLPPITPSSKKRTRSESISTESLPSSKTLKHDPTLINSNLKTNLTTAASGTSTVPTTVSTSIREPKLSTASPHNTPVTSTHKVTKPRSSKWNSLPKDGVATRSRLQLKKLSAEEHIHPITIRSVQIGSSGIPNTYKQAMKSNDNEKWSAAIQSELDSHISMQTWLPEPIITNDPDILGAAIATRWVFARKADGRYKGRLVARGDRQPENTYSEVYSPTLRAEIARSIFSTAVSNCWYFHQYDFTTAYLNSILDTDVYIYPPDGVNVSELKVPHGKRVVFKLNRGLYGLKQAGRLWHETLSTTLSEVGFEKSSAFPSTFIMKSKGKTVALLGLFVDDMIFTANSESIIQKTIAALKENYLLKEIEANDEGVNKFLGIDVRIKRDKQHRVKQISLSQESYIKDFVHDAGIEINKVYNTPLPPNFYFGDIDKSNKLFTSEKALRTAQTQYRSYIGSLLYSALMTRPDLTYAVNYLARFSDYPHPDLMAMVKRVMCYAYSTSHYKLLYNRRTTPEPVECYTDSDYAQDVITRKSMNGFMIYSNGHLVHWKSKYTPLVCTSSDQAEQQAIYMATNELDWFRPLLIFIGSISKDAKILLRVDNQSAIQAMVSDNFGAASKAYAVRTAKLKERYKTGNYKVEHISGELQLADILTKPIAVAVSKKLIPMILDTS